MKICEVVLRYLHNLPSSPPLLAASSSSTTDPPPSPSKKRKPAMPKVKIGLQGVVITLPREETVKREEMGEEDEKEVKVEEGIEENRKIYFWCLPSTSARVVEYQIRPAFPSHSLALPVNSYFSSLAHPLL
jgi:hypothetical protein